MSKINAVRLININYNHDAIRISDETMHFNGKSTLVSLQNGGGKSVLVQMITAPFVQKRYRNTKDRPFASYFTSGRPSFIIVEWALDQGAGYVMTGMMVRHSQGTEDGDELEMVNFISEYKDACLYDLHHLPVVEKTKNEVSLKSFAVCRQLFDSYKKDRSVRFFYYDMNNSAQSRQYFDKLMEYGINFREWQNIIKKVNDEESGLSKLFADCKDEKGLVEKWFLDAVENKLNKDQNRMQEFRNILEKYISLYHDNESKIKRRDVIRKFDDEALRISEQGEIYVKESDAAEVALGKIAAYIQELNRLLSRTEDELRTEQATISDLSEQLVHLDHEQHSSDYYAEQDQIDILTASITQMESALTELNAQKEKWIRTLHLLQCAKQQDMVDEDRAAFASAEQALDVCRRQNEDLAPERNYLGYLMKSNLTEQFQDLSDQIKASEDEIAENTVRYERASEESAELTKQSLEKSGELGGLETTIRSYDRVEERFNSHWGALLARNIIGEYEAGALTILQKTIDSKAIDDIKNRAQKKKRLEAMGVEIRSQEGKIADLEHQQEDRRQKLKDAQTVQKKYDEELQTRRTILQYLDLREDQLYDVEHILRAAESKIAELDVLTRKLGTELDDTASKMNGLRTGQTIEIPTELRRVFENLDIHLVYGMEWMKRNGCSEEQNLQLVEKHPFLPYALIMTAQELSKLQAADTNVYTSFPIPIITRESLSEMKNGEKDLRLGSAHFYMLFNANFLNEEKLQQMLCDLQRDLERKESELEGRKQEHEDYIVRRNMVQNQTVTKEAYQAVQDRITNLESELEEIRVSSAEARDHLIELNTENADLTSDLTKLGKQIDEMQRQSAELEELQQAYAAYQEDRRLREECKTILNEIDAHQKKLENLKTELNERIHALDISLIDLHNKAENCKVELALFDQYQKTVCPAAMDTSILNDIITVRSRYTAITEKASKQMQDLEADRKKAVTRLHKSEKELTRLAGKFGVVAEEWSDIHYSSIEEDHAENKESLLEKEIFETRSEKSEADKAKALAEQRQKQTIKQMERDCQTSEPLPREDIQVIDFNKEKNLLIHQRMQHQQTVKTLEAKRVMFDQSLCALSKYDSTAEDQLVCWEEDFFDFSITELRSYTGDLTKEYDKYKDSKAEARSRLERILNQLIQIEEFKDDFYKKPLDSLIAVIADAHQVLKQLSVIQQAYHALMDKLMADIDMVEKEKTHIVSVLQDYVHDVHDQMGRIDKNSSITIRGRRIQMLKIDLPVWKDNENLYHVRIEDMIDDVTKHCVELWEKNESLHEFLGKHLTTKELYDTVIGIHNVHIQLYKIEAQRELQITWREVAANSGGEGFLSAFVILSSLLYYMRRDDTDIFADRNEGKVLVMDNPFAQTNAAHLLKPLMDVAKRNNTQLICLTGLSGESIYNRFDNIYVLNLIAASLGNYQYLKGEHRKGNEPEILTVAQIEVVDEDRQMQIIF